MSAASDGGPPRTLLLATHNAHKLREFERLLRGDSGGSLELG